MPALIAFLLSFLAYSMAHANSQRYTANDIRDEIIGKRVFLSVPFGGEFPLNYRSDGKVDGSGEALGLGRFVKPEDRGKWWIEADRLCQQFETWYEGEPMCFELYRLDSKRLRWIRNNGQKGTARIGPSL